MSVLHGPRVESRRILHEGQPKWVSVAGDRLILADGRTIAEAETIYLPPCDPSKILCIHLNYESRRIEFRAPPLDTPTYFQKPVTALNAHRGHLARPANAKYLNYEGEVGVIIGKPMRNVGREEAWDYIAGFTPANDVGCQDYRDTDAGSMLRVKGQDGFCPVGPGIVSGVDIRNSTLRTYINGKMVQEGNVSEMTFPIDYILADLCRFITLMPGDLILSGTPKNSRPMNIGDLVEVEVSGIGRLANRVVEAPAAAHLVGHQGSDTDSVRRVALGGDFVKTGA
jgi:5-oxopent-3-ene-1,2,5-tricarboxylate decarboxylase/2-hydroxyhepta-2,4-diene-1,7-dioate isomerase